LNSIDYFNSYNTVYDITSFMNVLLFQ